MKFAMSVLAIACAFLFGYDMGSKCPHPIPGTIREVEVNGVKWRGEPVDSGIGVRYAKPVKGGR